MFRIKDHTEGHRTVQHKHGDYWICIIYFEKDLKCICGKELPKGIKFQIDLLQDFTFYTNEFIDIDHKDDYIGFIRVEKFSAKLTFSNILDSHLEKIKELIQSFPI